MVASVTATAGNLLLTGELTGDFLALDARTRRRALPLQHRRLDGRRHRHLRGGRHAVHRRRVGHARRTSGSTGSAARRRSSSSRCRSVAPAEPGDATAVATLRDPNVRPGRTDPTHDALRSASQLRRPVPCHITPATGRRPRHVLRLQWEGNVRRSGQLRHLHRLRHLARAHGGRPLRRRGRAGRRRSERHQPARPRSR